MCNVISKDLVSEKEEIKCNNINNMIKRYQKKNKRA